MLYGPDHQHADATNCNVAMMYQDIGKMSTVILYVREVLKKNEGFLEKNMFKRFEFNFVGAYKIGS